MGCLPLLSDVNRPANGHARVFHDTQSAQPIAEASKCFVPLPKRWVVEAAHAWGERCRRLVMHHDRKFATSRAWVWFAYAQVLQRRLLLDG